MRRALWTAALAGVAAVTLGGVGTARQDAPKKTNDPAPRVDPKDVLVGPPPELAALRAAVEAAAKKGENVDDVRAKLEALEKALAGKAWVRPKQVAEAPPVPPGRDFPPPVMPEIVRPGVRPQPRADVQPFLVPDLGLGRNGFGAVPPDLDAVLRGQALLLEAAQLLAEDPAGNRDRADRLRRQAQELMEKALGGAGRNGLFPPQLFDLPGQPAARGGNGRLGIRVASVPPAIAEENRVPEGRGVLVAEVLPNTAAERAGLKANDIIIEFAGQPVGEDPAAFVAQVQRARAGVKLDMTVIRDGRRTPVRGLELAAAADPGANRARLFAEIAPIVGADGRPLVEGLGLGRVDSPPAAPPARRSGVTVEVQDGTATVTGDEGGAHFRIVGAVGANGLEPTKIEVTENGRTVEAATVDGLPEGYRDRARQLLGRVRVGGR